MNATLNEMVGTVSATTDTGEKAAWEANADLWKMLLATKDAPGSADLQKMQGLLDTMTSNITKIEPPHDKHRWSLNRDLWKTLIDRMTRSSIAR